MRWRPSCERRRYPNRGAVSCSCVSTFRRLLGFLRPYRAGAIWSLVLAALAMVGTVAIPWLTGQAIDARRRRRRRRPAPLRPADRGRRRGPAGDLRRAPARRRPRVAGDRVRPAQPALRPPPVARARVLRPPADRAADVARDRRPAGRALLPRLRARLHHAERADDPARRGRDVSASTRCWRRCRCSRSRSWCSSRRATGAGRGPRCRRSSSGSRSSPPTSRRTSRACAW